MSFYLVACGGDPSTPDVPANCVPGVAVRIRRVPTSVHRHQLILSSGSGQSPAGACVLNQIHGATDGFVVRGTVALR